jgi:hypothetical protein
VRHTAWLALLGAWSGLANHTVRAQDAPTIFSIGQPRVWQSYGDALIERADGLSAGVLIVAGSQRSILNPVVGLLAGAAELYGRTGNGRSEAGVRGIARSPALAFGVGADVNVSRGRGDLLVTYQSAILRGGLLGHGTMLRVDWMPTRGQMLAVGIDVPLRQPLAGRTRPRHVDVRLPDRPTSAAVASATQGPDADAILAALDDATNFVRACSSIWSATSVRDVGTTSACVDAPRRYDQSLARAFKLAAGSDVGAATLASRARAGLLDAVLLPYDTLLGQVKKPADRIDGLTAIAQSSFARWLDDSTPLPPSDQAAAVAVHARWLAGIERAHRDLLAQWKDSRFVWLPLQLALAPDQYDEQAEVDALIGRAVGRPFTDGNVLAYLQSRDIPLEIARSIYLARDYHVLWTHDVTSRRHQTHDLDNIGYEIVADAYLPALTAAVKRYDETGRMPVYMIFLDQYFYEPRGGRLWMTLLENPLHASAHLPGGNAERESHLRERLAELGDAAAHSRRLQNDASRHGGDAWLSRMVKVHVNITDPSDFSFRSDRIVPPFPMAPDNLMRDHRKIVLYDLDEADPWHGAMLLMGTGVGEQFATATWEDRGYRLRGPATLEARAALRRLMHENGFSESDVPAPLRTVNARANAEPRANVGRALQVHNEIGWGAKKSSLVRAMLYDLVQPGAVIIVPDPQWVSPHWAAMLVGAAARGARVYVVAPSLANAPTPAPALVELMHDVMLRMLELRDDLQLTQEIRVGLFSGNTVGNDAKGRADEIRAGRERAPWLGELFPFDEGTLAVLRKSEARAERNAANATELAHDEIPREQKIHEKIQLIARPGAIAALMRQPGWAAAVANEIDMQAAETARITTQLLDASPAIDRGSVRNTAAMLRDLERGMSEEERKRASFYFTVGTQNQDPRGMVMDGEATLVTSGIQGSACVVDLYSLMARSTWVDDRTQLERELPAGSPLIRRLARLIWPAM